MLGCIYQPAKVKYIPEIHIIEMIMFNVPLILLTSQQSIDVILEFGLLLLRWIYSGCCIQNEVMNIV